MSTFGLDTWRIVWMVAAIFTSSLTAYWDIIYDFGLFNKYDKHEDDKEDNDAINQCVVDTEHDEYDLDSKFPARASRRISSEPQVSNGLESD